MSFGFQPAPLLLLLALFVPQKMLAASSAETVFIPGGTYTPAFRSDNKKEKIAVAPFWIDAFPVTVEGFNRFVKENPSWRKSKVKRIWADEGYLKSWRGDVLVEDDLKKIGKSPVTDVSWFAARAYAAWLGRRLPTTAEWEYLAATESGVETKKILDWYGKPTPEIIPPIGSGISGPSKVRDLFGLVWEWVDDFGSDFIASDSRERGDDKNSRFCGSGSLGASDFENYAAFMRYAFRSSLKAAYTVHNLGFRTAHSKE